MKKEFTKAKDILRKIEACDDNINLPEVKTPEWKELAWIGDGGEILLSQFLIFMIGMVIALITLFVWIPSFEMFIISSFIFYGIIMIPYTLYVRLTYNVSEIKRQAQVEEDKKPLYEEYHKALEAIDMDYLDYEKFTREEVLILMDKAELAGRKKEAISSRSNTTLMAATTAIAVSSTINS